MKPYFIDGSVLIKRMAVVLVAGLFVGAAVAAAGYTAREVEPAAQKKALAVCPMPQTEGEMTVYVVENGAIKCWRWK
tara:strand:+ start:326 stop:556 length:231 start_codon:yes stop_codon:yes gene_type:complete